MSLSPAEQAQPGTLAAESVLAAGRKPGVLVSVQALRGLAAFAVLLFHLQVLHLGFAGVDVFFVLSGFIMGTVGVNERPGVFIRRRLARIAPLYWVVTLAMCGMSLVPGLMRNFHFDLPSLIRSLLFVPYRDGNGEIYPLLVPGWTLNFEMMFYGVFAALLPSGRVREWALGVLLVLGTIGTFVAFRSAVLATYTSPLLFEFAAGLALSRGNPLGRVPQGLRLPAGVLALLAGVAGFVLFALLGDLSVQGLARAALLGGPAFLLVMGALTVEQAGAWPDIPGARQLGDASYSLYLTHGLVLAAIGAVLHRLGGGMMLEVIVGIPAAVLAAIVTYRWLERPLMRVLR